MESDVRFVIKDENLESGLRGYPCGFCTTSEVDPKKGLFYVGHPIAELAAREPIEVIYLLCHGKEGDKAALATFEEDLKRRSHCSGELIEGIEKLPRGGSPMKLFCAALLIAGLLETTQDYKNDSLNLIAKIPEIAAVVINHHAGWRGRKPSNPDLGYIENFLHMLNPPDVASRKELIHVLKLFNILHYDHDGGNLSTFVGKAVASGLEDLYGSMSAAMAALEGHRHGGANKDALDFVKLVQKNVGENPTEEKIAKFLRDCLQHHDLIYGFGHAVLRVEDPRATILYSLAEKYYPAHPLVKTVLLLRTQAAKILAENPKISDPYPNVDAISGTLLTAAGFPYPEYFPVLFGMARVVGIGQQIVYERCLAHEGHGTPIVRPTYYYKPATEK